MTIDFESVNIHGLWVAYGVIISQYPSGRIISTRHGACIRQDCDYDSHTRNFWTLKENKQVLLSLTRHLDSESIRDKERALCKYIRRQLDACPDMVILQDNPQFDCAILNKMMARNHLLPVSSRIIHGTIKYRSTICSKSFRSGIALGVGGQLKLAHEIEKHTDFNREITQLAKRGRKHDPINDAAITQSNFFSIIDFSNKLIAN